MRRPFAINTEVIRCLHDALAEQMQPDAVDHDAGGQWVAGRDDRFGQLQPTARITLDRVAAEQADLAPADFLAGVPWIASPVQPRVDRLALQGGVRVLGRGYLPFQLLDPPAIGLGPRRQAGQWTERGEEVAPVMIQAPDHTVAGVPVSVGQPDLLSLALEVEQPACHGDFGAMEINVEGGTPPLTIGWGDAVPEALQPGVWPIAVLDSVGCSMVDTAFVNEPDSLISTATFEYVGSSDTAFVTLSIEGGTPPYDVNWSSPIDTAAWVIAPTGLGWFVQDVNGCLDIGVIEIPSNPLAGIGLHVDSHWTCRRQDSRLVFSGPDGVMLEVRMFDLSGRQIDGMTVRDGQILELGMLGTVVVQAIDASGRSYAWVR